MTQWYVKDLSKLTHISVQTLHHYDRIDLLKPSIRLPNSYRVYSEKDLSKLQQIIALKFFGFELAQIKALLSSEANMIDHFMVQSQFLDEKAKSLRTASDTLKNIIAQHGRDKSIPWETIINVIEVYRMTQQIENTWVAKAFTPEELKNYAKFESELKTRFTEDEKKTCHQEWATIVEDIHNNLNTDPSSAMGIEIGQRCMQWVDRLYGKKNKSLSNAIWEKGFKGGHGEDKHGLSSEGVAWLDRAVYAYQSQRIFEVLNKITTHSPQEVLTLWENLMFDICGNEQKIRHKVYDAILANEKTSQAIKEWIKQYIQ
jgi:DNA-binding transcriptional MerR regulator